MLSQPHYSSNLTYEQLLQPSVHLFDVHITYCALSQGYSQVIEQSDWG